MRSFAQNRFSRQPRPAFTLTELIVSASMLVGVMGIVAPLTLRSGRLWQDTRHQQLALDELSNQLDYLTTLNEQQVQEAISKLELSPLMRSILPSATITGELVPEDLAPEERNVQLVLTLRIDGDSRDRVPRHAPISLVGWLESPSKPSRVDDANADGEETP